MAQVSSPPRAGTLPAVLFLASPQAFEKGDMELQSVDPGNTVLHLPPAGASSVFLGHSHCMWLGWTGGTRQSCHDVDTAGVG